jgi:hypothetical protein
MKVKAKNTKGWRTVEEVGIIVLVRVELEKVHNLSNGEITRGHTLSLQLVFDHLAEKHTGLQKHQETLALGSPDIVRNAHVKITLGNGEEGLLLLRDFRLLLTFSFIIRDVIVGDIVVRAGGVLLVLQDEKKKRRSRARSAMSSNRNLSFAKR